MTTAFPPNKQPLTQPARRTSTSLTLLISKNQPLYGAITARSYHPGG